MKNYLLVLYGFLVFGSLTQADSSLANPDFQYEDLRKLIRSSNITELDQLIKNLPPIFKKNQVFVYDSHGLKQELVTPDTPRIILYNKDASLIMAMTRNPGPEAIARGEDTLEILHFNKEKRVFETVEMPFDGVTNPIDSNREARNLPLCLKCHGQNPRPLLQDYNGWPGFYGSFGQEGSVVQGSKEYTWIMDFVRKAPGMPRYEKLNPSIFKKDGFVSIMKNPYGEFSPLTRLGQNLEFKMLERLGAKLLKDERFNRIEGIRGFFSYLGSRFCAGGAILLRTNVKKIYNFLAEDPQKKVILDEIAEDIKSTARVDAAFKRAEFMKTALDKLPYYNSDFDQRGLTGFIAGILFGNDPYYETDPEFMLKQLVLMELMYSYFDLKTYDISSDNLHPTLGIFHIREGSLYPDEQYFAGLFDQMVKIDPQSVVNCDIAEASAKSFIQNLPLPAKKSSGLLRGF